MAIKKKRRSKAKQKPKVVIDYPPVPTKKWIPPDKRPKRPKPEPAYNKPEGISQKLAISTLRKVWNKFVIYENCAMITGNFSQCHKRFTFKSNGFQGACNSAVACVYANLFKMSVWSNELLNDILIKGDDLYIRSTQQGDKCLIEVPPEKVHPSFFLGNQKITLFISPNSKMTEEIIAASEEKVKEHLVDFIEKFLSLNASGIFYSNNKYTAIWIMDEAYYFFDPGEHDEYGHPWTGVPGLGVSFLGRFKKLLPLAEYVFKNFPNAKEDHSKFHIMPCGVARIVKVNTTPPETFEDLAPQDVVFTKIIEDNIPAPPNPKLVQLQEYIEEAKKPSEPVHIEVQEVSPLLRSSILEGGRPSFLPEGPINKNDLCRYEIPIPTYLKGEQARLTYYTELTPNIMGILRGNTCQTDPNFSKYLGRQSMGNALSALIMLRFSKSKHWVPRIIDEILKNGEILYRDAMLSIPRTRSLRLSNFPKMIEYESKKFTPDIDEYALVGQMESQNFDILDLGPALEEFLADNCCCIILGPQILAVWTEDGLYYMFDPNERDPNGKAILKTAVISSNIINLDTPQGVACVVWCRNLSDLVSLYVNNTEKARRNERFYLSRVTINDYLEVPEEWNNFIGLQLGKWILRGTFNQASIRFSPESRNKQGTANAFVSLAMQALFDVQEWSSDTVDEILMTGDNFYQVSVEYLKEKGTYTNPHLMLNELRYFVKIRDKEAHYELEECVINGLINAEDENDLSNLYKGLEAFFNDNDTGVLTTRNISLAIWKKGEAFYVMYPYSRDDKGLPTGYGTSCVVRMLHLTEFASYIEANLDPNKDDFFNINKVTITLYEAGIEGRIKPPLNHYTAINDKSAILRSWLSEMNEKYEIRKGRQTVPMCLSAVSFNVLKPSLEWTKNDMDIILDKGDDHYAKSMAKVQQKLNEEEIALANQDDVGTHVDNQAGGDVSASPPKDTTQPADEGNEDQEGVGEQGEEQAEEEEEEQPQVEVKITSENVIPEFQIGPNNLSLEFTDIAEGNIKKNLSESLRTFYSEEPSDENQIQAALLETKDYTVAIWRDGKAYYVFDPKSRDKNGEVIGKEDWDPEPLELERPEMSQEKGEGSEEESEPLEPTVSSNPIEEIEEEGGEEEEEENLEPEELSEEEEEEYEEEEEKIPAKPKMPLSYWAEQERTGRACVRWFLDLEDLVKFVYENIPIQHRLKSNFVLKGVNVVNNLKMKGKHRLNDTMSNVYAGDWYDFKEIDAGMWIIRATLDLTHELFPEMNRGKQGLTTSIMALGIAHTFEMTCFMSTVPDTIIVYGDKLYTLMKRSRKKQLLSDPKTNLREDEIDWLVQHEEFKITDIPNKICVSKFMIEVTIVPNIMTGDIKAQNFEDILDVKRGLEKFFEDGKYGVLFAKGLYVAVWKGERIYYMFDGLKRGPNGIHSTIGSGCITRFLDLQKLADVFLQNIPVYGKNEFIIHKVILSRNICPREREAKIIIPPPKAVPMSAGLKMVVPGKNIISGTISQEDSRFGKGPNVMSAPIAIIALTMSIIHKPETWSRPIIDEVVILGSELYENSANELGFDFNPWEDKLDIYRVKKDFKIGVVKVNCELRHTDQRGLIDVKDSNVKNLRQGIESFFEENTHGILVTEPLTMAVWEQCQEDGDPLIYLFDPNPRSSTGMPLFTGTACVICCVNAKMASDHIIGCILDPSKRTGEFVIVPIEIVVGSTKTMKKQPEKSPTRSSVNILPRCSALAVSDQKKKLRKLAEEIRKKKEAKRQQMIGRNGYHLKGAEALLRGYGSQSSEKYCAESRNNQDIPNCIVSVVMHTLLPIEDWNYKHIDLILDTGNQLYIDSYISYGPKDHKLGMENVLRKFFIGNIEVHITVYKPLITEVFTVSKLNTVLEAYFQQESVCILNYNQQWISLFFKGGFFFLFDPHERDIEGNLVKPGKTGTAVVIRFDTLSAMSLKVIHNLSEDTAETETFSLWLISVDSK